MDVTDVMLGLALAVASFGTALLALWVMGRLAPVPRVAWGPLHAGTERVVFLLEDETLVDATEQAEALLAGAPDALSDAHRVLAALAPRFPGLQDRLAALGEGESLSIPSEGGDVRLTAEWRAGLTRIALSEDTAEAPALDPWGSRALSEEAETLRRIVNGAPMLVWTEDPDGTVRWANAAYVDAVARRHPGRALTWPLPRLFEGRPGGADRLDPPRRLSVEFPDAEGPAWFECRAEEVGDGRTLVFAQPCDALVRAESTMREFVQTLTKTFAHLTTGLAVFDRERRLALFNPALTDLSGLEPQFLSGRPSLNEFLDGLRETQRMPEPRDYKSWRDRIAALESAAATGTHIETWSLPGGQTFRVTGRPHPDGAVAFLFEDISAEISLTRRFRSELELGQAVVDSLDEAIAVFSSTGALLMSNSAYDALWQVETGETLAEVSVSDATRDWARMCAPTPLWGDLRDFVHSRGERVDWSGEVWLRDGRRLLCRFSPLAGGATLVGFSFAAAGERDTAPRAVSAG